MLRSIKGLITIRNLQQTRIQIRLRVTIQALGMPWRIAAPGIAHRLSWDSPIAPQHLSR